MNLHATATIPIDTANPTSVRIGNWTLKRSAIEGTASISTRLEADAAHNAQNTGVRGSPQAVRRLLRSVGLPEIGDNADEDDDEDDGGVGALAQRGGDRARDDQNEDERVRKQMQQLDERRQPAHRYRFIRAALGQPLRGLRAGQSAHAITSARLLNTEAFGERRRRAAPVTATLSAACP
jgi:hypothetical protein